jgi:hypothetical protein
MMKTKKHTPKGSNKVSSNKLAPLKAIHEKKCTTPTDAEANKSDEDQSSSKSEKDEEDVEKGDEDNEEDSISEQPSVCELIQAHIEGHSTASSKQG